MRPLHPDTIEGLRDGLHSACGECAVRFAEAVVRQVAHPLGPPASDVPSGAEAMVARSVIALTDAARAALLAGDRAALENASAALADDAVLLASFFQNLDLLCNDRCANGDAVAALVAAALERPPRRGA